MAPRPFRVVRRERETGDTWTLELEPASGAPRPSAPGQFTMLYVFGIGEVPISVSGEPDGPLVHTVRAVGAVTRGDLRGKSPGRCSACADRSETPGRSRRRRAATS